MIRKIILLVVVFPVFALGLSQGAFAIGQLTEPIVIENVMRGQEFTEVLTLLNSEDKKVFYELAGDGEIADWMSFYEMDDVSFENSITKTSVPVKSFKEVRMKIVVPSGIPNGEYTGQVAVLSMPEEGIKGEGANVSIKQRIGRDVSITVTDQEIIDISAAVIPNTYDVEEGKALKINIDYANNGNIILKPSIGFKVTSLDDGSTIFEAVFPYPSTEEAVEPKTNKIIPIQWQTIGQEIGRYKAYISVMLDNEVVQEEDFRFNIGAVKIIEENNGKIAGLSIVAKLGGGNLILGWFVIGIILLIIAAILILINKKRNS